MATKTYYASVNCSSSVAAAENLSNEYFVHFYKFLTYLSAANVVTIVALNTGSINNGGVNFWNQANSFGMGSHFVYRWNSSSTRQFDWYMEAQVVSGTSNMAATAQPFNVPTSGWGFSNLSNGASTRGIALAAAVCVSGTTSFNPWNGTGAFNQDYKGIPHWVPGAADRKLFVLPRSNDPGGAHNVKKENMGTLCETIAATSTAGRFHFFSDGDALLALSDVGDNATYTLTYVGPFELRTSLSGAGFCNSDYGMCMITSVPAGPISNMFTLGTTWGDTAGTTVNTANGGICFPLLTGSVQGTNDTNGVTFLGIGQQINTFTNQYDEFPIYVGLSEGSYAGMLGTLNTGLIRYIADVVSEDVTWDNTRAIFGGSAVPILITTPWRETIAPGAGTFYTGSQYTWTYNYG